LRQRVVKVPRKRQNKIKRSSLRSAHDFRKNERKDFWN